MYLQAYTVQVLVLHLQNKHTQTNTKRFEITCQTLAILQKLIFRVTGTDSW